MITKTFTDDGKRYYVRGKTKKEVERKIEEKKKQLQENIIKESNITLEKWAYRAIKSYKTNQADDTQLKYVYRMEHCILQYLGKKRVRDIKPIDIQAVMNIQANRSRTQVNEVYQQLKFLFTSAYENGIIKRNPVLNLQKPKFYKTERREITSAEREALLTICAQDNNMNVFLFMLFCGCRPNEALNLMGEDIQTLDGVPVLHIRGTKTPNADRYVPLNDKLYNEYKNVRGTLFLSPTGQIYTPNSYKRLCQKLKARLNFELGAEYKEDFTPYLLRHSFCCECCRKDIDIRITARLMGHSTISITNRIYTHIETEEAIKKSYEKLRVF